MVKKNTLSSTSFAGAVFVNLDERKNTTETHLARLLSQSLVGFGPTDRTKGAKICAQRTYLG